MEELRWPAGELPAGLVLEGLRRTSERKGRLLAVACCRHLEAMPPEAEFAHALEAAERFADGPRDRTALKRARRAVISVRDRLPPPGEVERLAWAAHWIAEAAASEHHPYQAVLQVDAFIGRGLLTEASRASLSALARCILGDPTRPDSIGTAGPEPPVVDLARGIYEDRAFDRLPILGDALEEAGCPEAEILAHCRDGGPHARGCWVVDLVLGRS